MPALAMAKIPTPRSADDVPVADLSGLYNEPDPRAYYAALHALDYQTPRHVQKLASWCCTQQQVEDRWILDVGCGFATNAAGLRHGIDPSALFARYDDPTFSAMSSNDLHTADREYFAEQETAPHHVAGLEVAENALRYGELTGLLSAGFSEDLTQGPPSERLMEIINQTSVITESGVPIFIFPYVLDTILKAHTARHRPWIVTAPPRYTDMGVYEAMLATHGYVLETVSEGLPHRRFVSDTEQQSVIADQAAMGLNNDREEAEGYILVNLYLARPESECNEQVVFEML